MKALSPEELVDLRNLRRKLKLGLLSWAEYSEALREFFPTEE